MNLPSWSPLIAAMVTALTAMPTPAPPAQAPDAPYKNAKLAVNDRVNDLLARMTLDEKIGQMTQADHASMKSPAETRTLLLGSVLSGGGSEPADVSPAGWAKHVQAYQREALQTRLGIPILYGVDAVHGHNNVRGAVIFPHHIGLGCTRNPRLIEQVYHVTAQEIAGTGIQWDFAPCLAVPQDERWGRTYEGFGETAELAAMMAPAAVRGLQGPSLGAPPSVLASAKHYVGDGGTKGGVDRGDTVVDEATLRKLHLAGYGPAIKAGAGNVMVSYSSVNGQKMHGNRHLITEVLKGDLGFTGFVVSDWNGIEEIPGTHPQKVAQAINAGIDMIMAPDTYRAFINDLTANVKNGTVPMSRIDDAVRRILAVKFKMGLFEHPFGDPKLLPEVGSAAHRAVARQAVRESQVLLVNKKATLPLAAGVKNVVVAGRAADDIGMQCGGWTISWQGQAGPVTTGGTTVLAAIKKAVPGATVTYSKTGEVPAGAQAAVVVIGELPYAEMQGDRKDLSLDPQDVEAVRNAKKAGVPVVVVLFSGRPMILEPILPYTDALIAAWLPGTEGDGIADVLFGKFNPTGKLSVTWPKTMAQVPINVGVNGEKPKDALFDYGFGLSYRR